MTRSPGRWNKNEIPEHWVEVDSLVAARMRSVDLEDVAMRKTQEGLFYAPYWARVICQIDGLNERARTAALRRANADQAAGSALSTLFAAIDDHEERLDLINSLVAETAQTIVCQCGQKFDSALVWVEHTRNTCLASKPSPSPPSPQA